ncbi:hypothetical protein SASPL_128468 [Salvia splendens]|uniref:DUF7054 domain-containing protein n=1 Tax=Salvia splendens TaxID=180675 RepID=A0A8X8XD78_SALSN|nr:uncharacterized protein LOC121750194 [Salvia splendens]KAG6410409.1 hypothetical protein SASPL_128468 [Salvia splendens]
MLLQKQKKNQVAKGNRFLISVNVLGSAGPIRFVVSEDELVGTVIDTALKSYAREGRLPVLGSNLDHFILYCPISGTEALVPWAAIGSAGVRNFVLCKKPQTDDMKKAPPRKAGGGGIWKSWFTKCRSHKISSH